MILQVRVLITEYRQDFMLVVKLHLWSRLEIIFDDQGWWSSLMIKAGDHLWSTLAIILMIKAGYDLWWSRLAVICDDHGWVSSLMIKAGCYLWLSSLMLDYKILQSAKSHLCCTSFWSVKQTSHHALERSSGQVKTTRYSHDKWKQIILVTSFSTVCLTRRRDIRRLVLCTP